MRKTTGWVVAGLVGCAFLGGLLPRESEISSISAREAPAGGRTRGGLLVLYDFRSPEGPVVKDRSGVGEPLDLRIADFKSVRRSAGKLEVSGKAVIRSEKPAAKIIDAVRRSNELTVEAWVRPARADQQGPARIVTLSRDPNERNFTLGQEGDRFDVRLRTAKASGNGLPSLISPPGSLTPKLTHVVYTRDRGGRARIYLDGRQVAEFTIAGAMSNWDGSFRLALANEMTDDRPWLGAYHLVAVYGKALSASEVRQNLAAGMADEKPVARGPRVRNDVVVLYDFAEASGDVVRDHSGVGKPHDLRIANPELVRRSDGALEVGGQTVIRGDGPADKVTEAVKRSGAITVEAWVRPAEIGQTGPARIVTLSRDISQRNFTLGQEGDRFDVRFRTSKTDANGIPSLGTPGKSLAARLTHVVYTRDRAGRARIYLDGKRSAEGTAAGDTSNWDGSFGLALANEMTRDRPWRGTYHLVAVYGRDLSPQEVEQNFRAGPRAEGAVARKDPAEGGRLFEAKVAPLLARHCLECHGERSKKGRLDLSRRETTLAGGKGGKAVVPGKSSESPLWEYVESGEMPKDRPPLSAAEKRLLREWIDGGAVWPAGVVIGPSSRDRRGSGWVRRLTVEEYIETVRSAVGVDISAEARKLLPRDLRADGFSNTAYNLQVDLGHVEAYAELARVVVGRMDVAAFARQFSKGRELSDANLRALISGMGKWLLRGPLEEREVTAFLGVGQAVAREGGDFDEAVRYTVEAMLQSPRFLYRIERQQGDGKARPVGPYELASRLSYILWGAPPDRELMRAADAGDLADRGRVEAQVRRMLGDPRAVERSARFVHEWLDLDRLETLRPDRGRYPKWDPQLAADMRAETVAFFKEVAWKERRPLADLFNARFTFATPRLARHYGLRPKGEGLQKYDLSSVPGRGGLLTQGGVLTVGGDEASTVTRGLFVLHEVLRGEVDDPPPCVDTTPVPTKPGLSLRAVAEARLANPSCGGCHARFEPLAFGMLKFDGLGAYHEADEHGNKLRDDGEVLFPGAEKPVAYKSSGELMDLLAKSGRVRETVMWKVTQFALGRPLVEEDVPALAEIHRKAQEGGGTYASLMTAIVMSDLVQKTRTETER